MYPQRIPISAQQSVHIDPFVAQQANIAYYQPQQNNDQDLRISLQNLQQDYQKLAHAYSKVVAEKENIGRQVVERDRQIVNLEHQMLDYQNNQENRHILEIESKRLQDIIQLQKKDIENLKNKNSSIEDLYKERKQFQDQGHKLTQLLDAKDRDIHELRQKNTHLEMQIADLKNQLHRISDMESMHHEFQQDIEQLSVTLKNKNFENDQQRQKILKLETAIQESRFQDLKIREYENRISLLAQEVKRLSELCKNQSINNSVQHSYHDNNNMQEMEYLRNKTRELSKHDEDQQLKIQRLSKENQVLQDKVYSLNQQLDRVNLQQPYDNFDQKSKFEKEAKIYEDKIENLSRQLDIFYSQKQQYSDSQMRSKIDEQASQIVKMHVEIQRLNAEIKRR